MKTKSLNRRVVLGVAGICLVWLYGTSFASAMNDGPCVDEIERLNRPNIILFLVDDMGWQDTSVSFHDEPTEWNRLYRTPHMERLAACGVRLTNAYAASPVCSPTRASIMTGMNPGRSRITDWVRGHSGRASNHNSELLSTPWNSDGLQPDEFRTLPGILGDAGYLTAHVGKAHFGARGFQGGHDPTKLGFEINIGGSEAGSPGSYYSPWIANPNRYPHLQNHPEGKYLTEALTLECKNIIDQAESEERPFFINMAHYAIHTPIRGQGDPKYTGNYQDGRPDVERDYAAMIESMDASLGELIEHLQHLGAAERTLIVFTSDNGGLSNHTRADTPGTQDAWRRDWHNAPLSSGKGSAYEGGLRVPMIVAWAGQEPDGQFCNSQLPLQTDLAIDVPVHSDDIFPTLLAVAQVDNPIPKSERDGQDLGPLLTGDSFQRRQPLVWHYPHQWYRDIGVGPGIRPFTAIRDGRMKLIYFYSPDGGFVELYDLATDLGEQNNLGNDENHQDDVKRLGAMLRKWIQRVDAQVPLDRRTEKSVSLANLPSEP